MFKIVDDYFFLILFGRILRNIEGIRMNLSKIVKRFLSLIMVIVLVGGLVLVFGSLFLVDDIVNDIVLYIGIVFGECSLIIVLVFAVVGLVINYGEICGLSLDDLDDDFISVVAVMCVM